MKSFIIAIICTFLVIPAALSAESGEENELSMADKAVAMTMRTMAKAILAKSDVPKLQKQEIDRINTLNDAQFAAHYAEMYSAIKMTRARYGFRKQMTKTQVIKAVSKLNEEKITDMIDSTPDEEVLKVYNDEVARLGKRMPDGNFYQKCRFIMDEVEQAISAYTSK